MSPIDSGVTLTKTDANTLLAFSESASLEKFTLTATGTYTYKTDNYSKSISQSYSVKSLFTTEFLSLEASESATPEKYKFSIA